MFCHEHIHQLIFNIEALLPWWHEERRCLILIFLFYYVKVSFLKSLFTSAAYILAASITLNVEGDLCDCFSIFTAKKTWVHSDS